LKKVERMNAMNIIVYEPNKEPYVKEIEGSLKSMQGIVGGILKRLE